MWVAGGAVSAAEGVAGGEAALGFSNCTQATGCPRLGVSGWLARQHKMLWEEDSLGSTGG